ncbi:MAG: MBL fold metallo-hydrolase [Pseudomonadota bacterium]|nr:MBL fold metallo-hydrolase [Pseudomonadota bacterium]
MARRADALSTNAPGDFYVDRSCIDCATCRWVAPDTFDRAQGKSRVHAQPGRGTTAQLRAQMALLACPVCAIGTRSRHGLTAAREAFPDPIEPPVYHCGYHSEKSFGAASYLILRDEGNLMIDSPRFTRSLVTRLEALGGIRWLFLTHRDDVADHDRFAAHFGCSRILHEADITPATRGVEMPLQGREPILLSPDVTLIPVPGHSAGSVCLLFQDRFLFSGDHLAWDASAQQLIAYRDYCSYSWEAQRRSVLALRDFTFEWILPGHGERVQLERKCMREALERLAHQM